MADSVTNLTKLFFLNILSLFYYINLRSSIIFFLFSGDMHRGISLSITIFSSSFVTFSELFCDEVSKTL